MPHIDAATLLAQLHTLGHIGAAPGRGRTRLAASDEDQHARDQLCAWMRELDMTIHIDEIGNIFGVYGDGLDEALMIGSHIDTVRQAGMFDGCYGVLAGLAVIRALRAANIRPARPVIIAAFTNEEGVRFHPDMMGSLAHAGGVSVADMLDARDDDGKRLGDELARIGYAGNLRTGTIRPREYLELHIEQGPVLEAENLAIGVVDSLQGISWQRVTIRGTANHAGTTPVHLRHDAGYAAAAFVAYLREHVVALDPALMRATVGSLRLVPDAINVIPGEAVFTIDLRCADETLLQQGEAMIAQFADAIAAREGVQVQRDTLARFAPVQFDAALADSIEQAVKTLGYPYRRMTSGAGHDAQMIARIAPAAMIFVPSRGGISHNPAEHTDDEHLHQGAEVLLASVLARLG
ncbi:MAG: Zn-dependent hydrolase [Cardiobacteriaceae bacterium]|nr:Zn-dependent hydrolase [Cardiobacteriaceae bacterium]